MTEPSWWIALLPVTDSFRTTVRQLVAELGGAVVEWTPSGAETPPPGTAAILVLGGGSEAEGIDRLGTLPAALPRYLVGASADHRLAAAAIQRGARDYFALPEDLDLLRRSLEREGRAVRGRQDAATFAADERKAWGFGAIIGRSPALRRTVEQAARVAQHGSVTVLIGGETGTGKELLARAIHYESPRAAAPFVEVNCAAIPANLLESELFGHEKGAVHRRGRRQAGPVRAGARRHALPRRDRATCRSELQAKLLRALESGEIRRVGGTTIADGGRAADRRDPPRPGRARSSGRVPRGPVLPAERGARSSCRRCGSGARTSSCWPRRSRCGWPAQYGLPVPTARRRNSRAALRAHRWPGNVRELRNAMERALVLSPPGTLQAAGPGRGRPRPGGRPSARSCRSRPARRRSPCAAVHAMLAAAMATRARRPAGSAFPGPGCSGCWMAGRTTDPVDRTEGAS